MLDGFKLRYYPFRLLVYIIVLNTIGVLVPQAETKEWWPSRYLAWSSDLYLWY